CRHSADDVEDLPRKPCPLQLRLVKRSPGTRNINCHYCNKFGHYKNDC
ncbi:unnamed protein product, partial [Ascophyllum nodosum]